MFVSFIHVNTRTKEKLIEVKVKYLQMLPYLKSDGTVLPYGSFPFLAVVHRVCGTLHGSSITFNSRMKFFGHGKLWSKWEGPFKVIDSSSHGAITLQNDEGT